MNQMLTDTGDIGQHTNNGMRGVNIKDRMSKRNQMEMNQQQHMQVDPNMRHLVNEVSETVGPTMFDQTPQLAMQTAGAQVMMSD